MKLGDLTHSPGCPAALRSNKVPRSTFNLYIMVRVLRKQTETVADAATAYSKHWMAGLIYGCPGAHGGMSWSG